MFPLWVLCSLGLFKLRTDGKQTVNQKASKMKSKFLLILG